MQLQLQTNALESTIEKEQQEQLKECSCPPAPDIAETGGSPWHHRNGGSGEQEIRRSGVSKELGRSSGDEGAMGRRSSSANFFLDQLMCETGWRDCMQVDCVKCVQCTVYRVQSTLNSVQYTVYSVQCTEYNVH